jgi:hypothetical protein
MTAMRAPSTVGAYESVVRSGWRSCGDFVQAAGGRRQRAVDDLALLVPVCASDAAISLTPAAAAGPPTGVAVKGDLMVDSAGVLHLRIADGSPGTWIPVSHGGARMLASPQRPYSSTNPGGGVFVGGEIRRIQIVGPTPGAPSNAIGIVGNLTVHSTRGAGYLTAYPAGTKKPFTSNLNWFGDGQLVANSVTVRLGAGGAIDIYADTTRGNGQPAAHVIVDVAGYLL